MPGKKTFVDGTTLTASDVNGYLMNQSVMRFASATARDAAITSPTEGMMCYLDDVNWLMVYTGSAWTITGGDMPYFAGDHVAKSIPNGTGTTMNFSTAVNRGGFTNSSGTITVPVTGRYQIVAYGSLAPNATGFRILNIICNGFIITEQMTPTSTSSTDARITTTATVSLSAGNPIVAQYYQNSGGALNTTGGRLQINYLGA